LWLTRCVKHLRLDPLDTLESVVFPGAGASRPKKWERVRAGGLIENVGETEIGGWRFAG
jgi:hypothetical protein